MSDSAEYRVEILDANTEQTVGYIDREDDENPNSGSAVRIMTAVWEVRERIQDFIDTNKPIAGGLSFWVTKNDVDFGCVYHHEGRWVYELDESN